MLPENELSAQLKNFQVMSFNQSLYRIIDPRFCEVSEDKYLFDLLSDKGALKHGGRYNIAHKFGALYCSISSETAFKEATAIKKSREPNSFISLALNCSLFLLDITLQKSYNLLATDRDELTELGWISNAGSANPTKTQILGRCIYNLPNIDGMIVPSAEDSEGSNVVIFLNKLASNPSSFVEVRDPSGKFRDRFPRT